MQKSSSSTRLAHAHISATAKRSTSTDLRGSVCRSGIPRQLRLNLHMGMRPSLAGIQQDPRHHLLLATGHHTQHSLTLGGSSLLLLQDSSGQSRPGAGPHERATMSIAVVPLILVAKCSHSLEHARPGLRMCLSHLHQPQQSLRHHCFADCKIDSTAADNVWCLAQGCRSSTIPGPHSPAGSISGTVRVDSPTGCSTATPA